MPINLEVNDTICYVQVTKMSRQSVQFCLDVNLLKKIEHTPHRYTILYSSTIYKYFLMFIKYKNFNLSIMNFQLSNLKTQIP